MTAVTIRVYGPLNDFLPAPRRQVAWTYAVDGHPSVKDVVESAGVPHPEIDLILVNGVSVPFEHAVRNADRVAVFPRFMTVEVGPLSRVRPPPLPVVRFVADVHLGRLARQLRLAGFDTAFRPDADDASLAGQADCEERILLTRDQALLKRRVVAHGYFVRETEPHRQLVEVLRRFDPLDLQPFSRCLRCNGVLREVAKSEVEARLPPRTRQHYEEFRACGACGRLYWKGAHWRRLEQAIEAAQEQARGSSQA